MSRKRTKISGDNNALSSNPFAAALGGLEGAPSPETSSPDGPEDVPEAATPDEAGRPLDFGRRAIVRRQSKGQGGKTVSCVEGLPQETASEFLPRLKRELGCNGRIDADVLILGTRDHARVAAWLRDAGVPRVKLGN